MSPILCVLLCVLQYITLTYEQNVITMPPLDVSVPTSITLSCSNNYVVIVHTAFYGVAQTQGSVAYQSGDCIADGMSSILCLSDTMPCTGYVQKKKLSQCQDQQSDYFHVEYDCVPISMDDPSKNYDICQNGVNITSDHGIIVSPDYPAQVQPTGIECFRAITIPDDKTLRLWLTDMFIGSTSTNCAEDHVYVVDNVQTYRHCGEKRLAYSYLCSSTILIQYLIKTVFAGSRGMRMYFEITDRPANDNCPKATVTLVPATTTTGTTIDPSTTTETPSYAQLGIASPTQSFQLCSGQSHTIECPEYYAVAIIQNLFGVTQSGQCTSYDPTEHCAVTVNQLISCRRTCSFQYPGYEFVPACNSTSATYQYVEYQCIPTNTSLISPTTICPADDSKTEVTFDRNGRFQSYNYPVLTQMNCTYRLKTKPGNIIHVYALDISLNSFSSNCQTNAMTLIEDGDLQGTEFCEQRTYSLIYSSCSNELDLHYAIGDATTSLSFGINLYLESQTRPWDWSCGSTVPTTTTLTTTRTTPLPATITAGPFTGAMDEMQYDICYDDALNLACPEGYTFMINDAFYGVKGNPLNKCGYVKNDCVQEATATITQCHTDSPNCYLPYFNKRRLAQCSDQYADYLHVFYQCVPSSPVSTPASFSLFNICDEDTSIRDLRGVVTSPDFPQYTLINNGCSRDISGVQDRLLKVWLNELSIYSGGQRSSNDFSEYSNQADLIIYKTNEFEDVEEMYPSVRDACPKDYFILDTRFTAYVYCGMRKLALEPICTSSATIQYKTTSAGHSTFKGFKLYFEWIEKPMDVICVGTPGTIDPSASTTTPLPEILPPWAQNLDVSPILNKQICLGAADLIRCPRADDYVIAIEDSKYAVTGTGTCDLPSPSDCYQKGALGLTCTHACPIEYIVPKPLAQCEDRTADYLSIDYECIPTRLANGDNPIDICASTTTDTIALDQGIMISPHYPSLNSSRSCSKTIETVPNKIWMVYLVDLFLESEDNSGTCLHGSLTISDGKDAPVICGLQPPQLTLMSCSNIVQFSFQSSQEGFGYRGFKMFFRSINAPVGWSCTSGNFTTTTQPTTSRTTPPVTLIPLTEQIAAYGGTVPANVRQYCKFPFTYQGKEYTKCIADNPPDTTALQTDDPWCALTSDYDTNHQWGFCDIGVTDATLRDVCRSGSQKLNCAEGYLINIVAADLAAKADGGTSCAYDQTDCFQSDMFAVQTSCAGKKSCTAYHSGKTLASCQNRLSAYLHLEYTCVPNTNAAIKTYDLCNNSELANETRRGYLISPSFPNTPSGLNCTFDIQPSRPRQDVYIYAVDMGLNAPDGLGQSCSKDRLIITAGSNWKEVCGLAFTNLQMKTCHTPLSIQLIRSLDAIGRGVKLYFEFRDLPPDEFCNAIIIPVTPSTLVPTTSTKPSPPSYYPNPSNLMVKTLCYPDPSGSFGANNFQCPSDYILVINRAFYGVGSRCAFTAGDCISEAEHVHQDCSGKPACSVEFENSITLSQCDQAQANYLTVEYQCLPTVTIAPNIADLCTNQTHELVGSSGVLRSPSYPSYATGECINVTLIPPEGSNSVIFMYVLEFNIGGADVETGRCTDDYLMLYYQCGNQTNDLQLCGTRPAELLFETCSPTDRIFASYKLTNPNGKAYSGFALLYHLLAEESISTQPPVTKTTKAPKAPDTSSLLPVIGGVIGGLLFVVLCIGGYLYYRRVHARSDPNGAQAVQYTNVKSDRQAESIDGRDGQNSSIRPGSFEVKTYHEQIQIKDGSIGNSYEKLFKRFFDDTVTHITIEDPYIRAFHQICNFLRLCEAAMKLSGNIKRIDLITSFETNDQAKQTQIEQLNQFKEHLAKRHSIDLTVKYVPGLHDREIRLDNGWMIKIGRGLDFYKPPECKLSIGYYDLDLRPCHQTTIDIFHAERIHPST